ncbi:MAG TPA: hypothetical protein DDZ88_22065 [Verrucomicrobiales bacterium]|nr:hypothetical protein [Verrucomicrobiales bacterium]
MTFLWCCLIAGALESGKSGDAPTEATASPMSRVKAALAEPEEKKRWSLLEEVAAEMGRTQPLEGKKIVDQLPTITDKRIFGGALMREWGKKQPQEALAAAMKLPAGLARRSACAAAIEGWAANDPAAAMEWAVKKLAGSNRREAVARGAAVWAKSDPLKVAEWAVEQNSQEPGSPSIVIEEVMRAWAVQDPQKAGEWSLKLPEGDFRDLALSAFVFRWADDKPEQAAAWLTEHMDNDWLVPRVAAIWASNAPADAANWVMQSGQDQALSPIMLSWADDAPEEALQWCKANVAGDLYAELRDEILGTWAMDDGFRAMEWVQNLSSPEEGAAAAVPAMEAWLGASKTPLPQISAWVSTQKQGLVRSVCLQKLAIALEPAFPMQAMTAALKIQDRKMLQETLKTVWTAWKERDGLAARAWLNEHPEAQSLILK